MPPRPKKPRNAETGAPLEARRGKQTIISREEDHFQQSRRLSQGNDAVDVTGGPWQTRSGEVTYTCQVYDGEKDKLREENRHSKDINAKLVKEYEQRATCESYRNPYFASVLARKSQDT